MKIFVDDAKIKDSIKSEEDIEKLQENLDKLYLWEATNKMKFNGSKFQSIRYGQNEDLKNNTMYFTANMEGVIEQFSNLRDLGIILSDDAKFDLHIEKSGFKSEAKVRLDFQNIFFEKNWNTETAVEDSCTVPYRLF